MIQRWSLQIMVCMLQYGNQIEVYGCAELEFVPGKLYLADR